MSLKNKIALVTGGASGIGRAASLAFAREGADVAFTYLTSAKEAAEVAAEIEKLGRKALAIKADLTKMSVADDVVAAVESKLGPIFALFANAGGLIQRSRIAETTAEFWDHTFAVNVSSTFYICSAALKRMEPRGAGAIVTMSSLAAYNGGGPGAVHYAATKGAIVSFTRGLAKEAAAKGIRVNGVAPGMITTRFHDVFNTPEGRKAAAAMTPLGREGTADEVADAVVFLASDKSSFLVGEMMQVNGGLMML